ncbi:metal ABC transporter permease [Betaproteobacteria bacterium]|nr:metal ABC transporter permease [Betaproteobacteria bacterium]GHU41050.1 metal ABC transporter permease [Betaproteobacteria bacterium]
MMAWIAALPWIDIAEATQDTFIMLGASMTLTLIFGLPLGVLLFLTGKRQLLDAPIFYNTVSFLVNVFRSVPFIILLIVMMPATEFLTGTTIGIPGVIPPLVVGAAPFFARLVETAFKEVDRGIIEATQAMGATTRQIVLGALLPEALPGIIAALTVTAIALVSYTAMSGLVGGGGLGDLAVRYGYHRYQNNVLIVTVLLLLLLVQCLQMTGDWLVRRFTRR